MLILLVGCEYSGTSTISKSLRIELKDSFGSEFEIHDHWKLPNIECYPRYSKQYVLNKTDKSHISKLTPKLKEMLQRQSLVYHLPAPKVAIDKIYVGYHLDDTVYGPIYFDYGGPKEPQGGPRTRYARYIEKEIIKSYPNTILIHLTSNKDTVLERMMHISASCTLHEMTLAPLERSQSQLSIGARMSSGGVHHVEIRTILV